MVGLFDRFGQYVPKRGARVVSDASGRQGSVRADSGVIAHAWAPVGWFVAVVTCLGAAVVLRSAADLVANPPGLVWVVLTVLAVASGAAVLRLRAVPASFSIGDTFTFAALFLFGPAAAAITVALETLTISLRLRVPYVRGFFNVAVNCLTMWLAGRIVFGLGGLTLPGDPGAGTAELWISVALCAALYFLLQTACVATAVAIEGRLRPTTVWRTHFLGLWPSVAAGAYFAALIATVSRDGIGVLVWVLPMPVLLYVAFRNWLGRVDDEMRHLGDINRAYHSTIEAFASAVDAKDQVTHGHVRRVQSYCLALARAVGATDPAELKALEAGALLHDLGKLAIPEHILNKPGKLTPAEFEHMKQHVMIGVHILSAIEFPFPVLPIVRHHHERWDGSGYPDGLHGADIPIGARILSVVDCFDALTSDRPYRMRMSTEEAFAILLERRGTVYDALLVDTFIALYPTIAVEPESIAAPVGAPATYADARVARPARVATEPAPSPRIVEHLAALLPGALCVLYERDRDLVVATDAAGPSAAAVRGYTITCGQRVTGWAVARGRIVETGEADIDLGPLASAFTTLPKACACVPIRANGWTAGALTVYVDAPLSEAQLALVDAFARTITLRAELTAAG